MIKRNQMKLTKTLLSSMFILICFASIGSATDYYVSNDGSDLSSGLSINDAWATPSHAVSKTGTASTVGAGDTIYLLDGIWRDEVVDFKVSGKPGNPITMTAYDGATPVIYTDDGHSAWGSNENGYFGIEIRGQEYINISGITMGGYRADVWIGNSDNIHISDMHLGKYGSYDSQFAMMMYYDVHNSSLTNSVCSGSYHDTVCVWGHTYNNNPSIPHITTNILIDGNVIKDSSTHNMVDLNDAVRNIMISNNTISDDAETGVWMHTYDEIYENITIKDNNFVDCYRAIRPINTTNLRIIGNTFTNTGSGGDIRMYGEYSGAQAGVNRNVYVADNVFDEIPHFETVVTGLFENNTIKSDEYYRFENCRDIVVRNENGNNFEIRANSNTDGVFEYTDGRVFKATRTSGTNYASPNTVISSPEGSKLYMKSEGTNLFYDFIIDHNSINDDINHAPVLNTVGSRTVDAGNTLSFTVSASDVDGDALVYSASGLPEGAIFDSTSGSFIWTPSAGQAGSYTVIFEVKDGQAADSETIRVTVNAENVTPIDENVTPIDENVTPTQRIIYDNRLRGPSPDATLAEEIYIDIGHYKNRGLYRDVMWFDLSDYNETDTITNATLSLYWYFPATRTRANDTVVEIYKPAEWDPEYVSWNNRTENTPWDNEGGDWFDVNNVAQGNTPYASITFNASDLPDNGYHEFDVTELVQDYVSGNNNTGFFLKARDESTHNYIAFYSSDWSNQDQRPTLNITTSVADLHPRWDVNEDGVVDILDISVICENSGPTSTTSLPRCDVNQDGTVDIQDVSIVTSHFGETVN